MDTTHWILIITTLSGYAWGYYQLRQKRKFEKQDKIIDKKLEVYQSYLKKADEINSKLRKGQEEFLSIISNLFESVIQNPSDSPNQPLTQFSSDLYSLLKESIFTKNMLQSELNTLQVFGDEKVLEKVREYQKLADQQNEQIQKLLNSFSKETSRLENEEGYEGEDFFEVLSSADSNNSQINRQKEIEELHETIIQLMRSEIKKYQS